MISIRELHAGDGYRYLLNGVADGEQHPGMSPVTVYYTDVGNPPGRWIGSGLSGLAGGAGVEVGAQVSEQQMERLFRAGSDPITGEPLGRTYRVPKPRRERVETRIAGLDETLTDGERAAAVERIEAEEAARKVSRPVSGFDVTFSPPKSVSVLWGLADQGLREQIYEAHQTALAETLTILERDVARTRIGTDGVAQVATRGVVATAFDHWDSRAGDPQLHTHVVIANRVQGEDGKWRTLDSRGSLFPATVALSELYDNLLGDHVTARLGIGWDTRGQARKAKNTSWELAAVPDDLISAFSTRGADIEREADRLVAEYRQRHGRTPSDRVKLRLRQIATLATRPVKELRPLRELTTTWVERARLVIGTDPRQWVSAQTRFGLATDSVAGVGELLLRVDDLAATGVLDQLAEAAFAELSTERSTWKTWNIRAAAARAAMPYRMVDAGERDRLILAITDKVTDLSVDLTPQQVAHTPATFTRGDGSSMFTRTHGSLFTSTQMLQAEQRLLAAGRYRTGPAASTATIERVLAAPTGDRYLLGDDQADAVRDIASSARRVDVLVGPAGAGKTTTLAALRAAWEADYGERSVIGMAPSAAAADVLADAVGIGTDNTAKWVHELAQRPTRAAELAHLADTVRILRRGGDWQTHLKQVAAQSPAAADWHATFTGRGEMTARAAERAVQDRCTTLAETIRTWRFHAGQLVIVDEASLAGTLALDALTAEATQAGAKLLLVGDWAQLAAVEAGGAFGMLVRDRGDQLAPELTGVRRFTAEWERTASTQLRIGDAACLDTYAAHRRLVGGEADDMLDAAYQAWLNDEATGKVSLLIAGDNGTVRELNTRARTDKVAAGDVATEGVSLRDGTTAGIGDRIVTRSNDRRLTIGTGWVKNGDTWTVRRHHSDGSLTVQRLGSRGTITLPAAYVAEHVELAYATTAHRAQGSTVDTAHAVITGPTMTREVLYVAMTRGRDANHAYVTTDLLDDEAHLTGDGEPATARSVLTTILRRQGATLSAHETAQTASDQMMSIGQLAAEYDTIHRTAQADRHAALIAACGLDPEQATTSPHYPALAAAIHRADAYNIQPAAALTALTRARPPTADEDPAAVLAARLARWTDHALASGAGAQRKERRLIAGLIPAATNITDPDLERALTEREHLLEQRATQLATQAIRGQKPWVAHLGKRPEDQTAARAWDRCVATIAAYRERWNITDTTNPLGDPGTNWTQRHDHRHASKAADTARELTGQILHTEREHHEQHRRHDPRRSAAPVR